MNGTPSLWGYELDEKSLPHAGRAHHEDVVLDIAHKVFFRLVVWQIETVEVGTDLGGEDGFRLVLPNDVFVEIGDELFWFEVKLEPFLGRWRAGARLGAGRFRFRRRLGLLDVMPRQKLPQFFGIDTHFFHSDVHSHSSRSCHNSSRRQSDSCQANILGAIELNKRLDSSQLNPVSRMVLE